jgi:hypothetical protein
VKRFNKKIELMQLVLNEITPEIRNGALARQIAQRIKSSFLGILVIDEMQRLKFQELEVRGKVRISGEILLG